MSFLDISVFDSRKVILLFPALFLGLLPVIRNLAFLESFPLGILIKEIRVSDGAEIEPTLSNRDVLRPIILDALVLDKLAKLIPSDFVRTRTQWRFTGWLGDIALFAIRIGSFPPMLWKNNEIADNMRQFPVSRLIN